MFREAHEFWKLHLNAKQDLDEIVDTEPIEEVKIEMLDHDNDAYPADYLEYTTKDGMFVVEPGTVGDSEVTSLDIVKLEENDDDNKKSNIIKENRNSMYKTAKFVKRSVFNCDAEFLEDKTTCVMKSPITIFGPFTGGKSVSAEGIPIFDCEMCDKGKFKMNIDCSCTCGIVLY